MSKHILLSGSSGFVGSYLFFYLQSQGYEVIALHRQKNSSGPLYDPKIANQKFYAIIHLAGENLLGYWTKKKKKKIFHSRIDSTKEIVSLFQNNPPVHFVCASAVGFYGDRKEEKLDEESTKGEGFLADVCLHWEKEAAKMPEAHVHNIRLGLVLGKDGGILQKLIPAVKLALGAVIGKGDQYISWVSIADVAKIIAYLIKKTSSGPVNVVAPTPIMQKNFIKKLASLYKRPCFITIPRKMVSLLLGNQGKEMLLSSLRVYPKKLLDSGYIFEHADLKDVIDWIKND